MSLGDLEQYINISQKYRSGPFDDFAVMVIRRYNFPAVKKIIFEDSIFVEANKMAIEALNCGDLYIAKNEIYYRVDRCFASEKGVSVFFERRLFA